MTQRSFLLSALIAGISGVILLSCTSKPPADSDIIATWGDTAMTVAQFKDKMNVRHSSETTSKNQPYQNRLDVITEYLVRDLKLLEGRRLGFDKRVDIKKAYDDATEQKAGDMLYNREVRDRVITPELLNDFFEHSKYEVRARHLLIKMDPKTTGKDTLAYWNRILDLSQQVKGGASFANLIDQYSEDETVDKSLHGDLGYFAWGKMVDEFQDVAWNLKPGEVSPPVRTRYGYHLIQVLDKRSTGFEVNTMQILVKCSRRATPAETTLAWNRAMEILKEAQKSGANFTQVARKYNEDKKTWDTGEVGWVPRGTMPNEYWDLAFAMKIGAVGGPVRSYKGYHILKVLEQRDKQLSIDDPEFRNRLYSRISKVYGDTLEKIATTYIDSVKRAFGMRYNDDVIKTLLRKLGDKTIPQNMSLFSALTPEDREMVVLNDNMGGMKVQVLVDQYGDNRMPLAYRAEPEFIYELVNPLILPKYLAQAARSRGFYDDRDVVAEGTKALDNAMLPEVEREMVYNKSAPTEDQIKDYYQKNLDKYGDPATATVFEIQVDNKQLADDMMGRIKKGEDIATLAQRYTMRTVAKQKGGKLGPFAIDKYGTVSKKAFELKPGELAGPIQEKDKYSVIKLVEKSEAKVKKLDEVRSQVEGDVRFQGQKDLKNAWEAELRKSYNLKINESMLRRVWPIITPLPDEEIEKHKNWEKERGDQAKRKGNEDQIKLKLQPGSEQEFTTKEGKQVKVKIGQPEYRDKQGNVVPPSKAGLRITPQGTLEGDTKGMKVTPQIELKPQGEQKAAPKPVIKLQPKPKTP